jgi:phosphonate transport system substrate-binding protein
LPSDRARASIQFIKTMFKSLTLAAALLLSLVAAAFAELSLPKVVIALKPDKNPEQMLQERKTLSEFLSSKLGKPVEVIVPLTSAVILEGMANGTIDLGYLSATDMINAHDKKLADILLAGEIEGQNWYKSYWVSLKEKPYDSVDDLRGKPIAFSGKTSTSGYLIPVWDMKQKGLLEKPDAEAFFGKGNVWFGTGYVSAIERVLNGEAEAAAVSYYVLDQDKHLTAEQRAKLKKVTEQGPVPTHVIAVRATISAADREALLQAVNALNDPANSKLRDSVFTSKLVPVDVEKHLGPLREALKFTAASNDGK